ncbi:protein eva-1 homolog C isoform X2 [Pelobates fuscus]|uniref:protein eva-1 homolog C isoform X2 n=1 Tax=Pelobates fuscus TaxID=191477 RepID=UPI002FE4859C
MIQRDGCDRRQVEPLIVTNLVYCILLLYTRQVSALADFSGYLTKLLQNHTVFACDGEHLILQCPRHSTVSVQSAFYGRSTQGSPNCTSSSSETMQRSNVSCMALTAFQKVLDECQNLRSCQVLVNSRVFGPDPCPGITKYLLVSYKCKPTEYKSTTICENTELKLHCKEPKLLNIYSAVYGSFAYEKNVCPAETDRRSPYDCLSYSALDVLAQRCYGKQRCKMTVNDQNFGSPCLPGVSKYLTINYSCVPKIILTEVDPKVSILMPSLKQNDDIKLEPRETRLPNKDGIFLSNVLAAFSYIRDHPESAALYFVSSVCVGLIFTLFALVIRISWKKDQRKTPKMNGHVLQQKDLEESANSSESESSTKSHFSEEFQELCKASRPVHHAVDAADLAERIERREQIIQEILMNSGLDLPPCGLTNSFF